MEEEEDESEMPSNELTWFDDILHRIQESIPSEPGKIEGYYCPKLNAFFKKVFDDLPLWSAVMKDHFKSKNILSTSNDTESRFNVIKNVLFRNNKLPIRPDTVAAYYVSA